MASAESNARRIELGWNAGQARSELREDVEGVDQYLAGTGWRLLGTYNALDAQRVFRFGAALGRRFVRVPIPAPTPELFQAVLEERVGDLPAGMRSAVGALYKAHHANDATQLGPALFLGMCGYLRAAGPDPEQHALAEAYVVHAGTWLAHLDDRDLDALGKRILAESGLPTAEWEWINLMIRALA